eukprot:TRINITY_DN18293_c0_g1_i1.p2 TRINITY_DN18293_c0_g1~~TRINITY_DN18293_c0_g1_i1.p2  ORF type:complete len:121 (+),score=31.48 TRINITY_DN18293_c0_g1_i1:331-693(+)
MVDGKAKCTDCTGVEVQRSAKAQKFAAAKAKRRELKSEGRVQMYKCPGCREPIEKWGDFCAHWKQEHPQAPRPGRKDVPREWIDPGAAAAAVEDDEGEATGAEDFAAVAAAAGICDDDVV